MTNQDRVALYLQKHGGECPAYRILLFGGFPKGTNITVVQRALRTLIQAECAIRSTSQKEKPMFKYVR